MCLSHSNRCTLRTRAANKHRNWKWYYKNHNNIFQMLRVIIHFWKKQRENHFPQSFKKRCVFNLVKFDAIIIFTINYGFAHLIITQSGLKAATRRPPPTSSTQHPRSCHGTCSPSAPGPAAYTALPPSSHFSVLI